MTHGLSLALYGLVAGGFAASLAGVTGAHGNASLNASFASRYTGSWSRAGCSRNHFTRTRASCKIGAFSGKQVPLNISNDAILCFSDPSRVTPINEISARFTVVMEEASWSACR